MSEFPSMDEPGWAKIAVDAIPDLVVVVDGLGMVVYANERAGQLLGRPVADWIGRPGFDLIHPDDLTMAAELIVSAQATGPGVKEPVMYRFRRGDDTWLDVEVTASGIEHLGRPMLVLSGRPRLDCRPHHVILDEIAGRLSHMFDDAAIGLAQMTLDGRFLRANPQLATDLGRSASELSGTRLVDVLLPEGVAAFERAWCELVDDADPVLSTQISFLGVRGTMHAIVTGSIVTDRNDEAIYVALQVVDVTDRVVAEAQLRRNEELLREAQIELLHQTTHDPLTGLGNRTLMDEILLGLERDSVAEHLAVVYIDLDGFKEVNDAYGHAVGDDLLVHVSERLRTAARASDTVIRVGGDEFVIIAQSISADEAQTMAERLLAALGRPFLLTGAVVQIAASAGLATALGPIDDFAMLVSEADRALYQAKRNGRSQVATVTVGGSPHGDRNPISAAGERW